MISWILIGILVVIAVILLKFKEIRHRASLFAIILILLFFVITAGRLYSQHKVDLKSFDGIVTAGKVYWSWLAGVFHNAKDITGYAIKQDWGFNSTDSNKNINPKK